MIIGYNDMKGIFSNLNALFTRSYPGFKFIMRLDGTATAAPALIFGASAFAPMGAEFSALELQAYRSYWGADPVAVRVAHCSVDPRALSAPVGIFVNVQNPIDKLTTAQVERIFSTGANAGDITQWGQLGLPGEWAGRAIHPCGIAEEAAAGLSAFMLSKMGKRPFTPLYDGFAQSAQVLQRVGEDPAGIGFASGNLANPRTKVLAIAGNDGRYFYPNSPADIMSGNYAYDRYLYIYIRRSSRKAIDPFVKDYLRLVLSQEGQQAMADAVPRYLPLNAREIKEELLKLEQ